jgi:hypothetical protein
MHGFTRRQALVGGAGLPLLAQAAAPGAAAVGERRTLKVQPVLIYQIFKRRPQTSWRPWGGLFTDKEVAEEKNRIGKELASLAQTAGYPLEALPLREVRTVEEGKAVAEGEYDTLLMYPASGGYKLLESVARADRSTLIFLRHRSGPLYV